MSFFILVLVGLSTGKQLLDEVAVGDRLIWSKKINGSWNCGAQIRGAILCRPTILKISRCYCVYFDPKSNTSLFGQCFATCYRQGGDSYYHIKRYSVANHSMFNARMCQHESARTGRFCGSCIEGHGLAVYSYHISSCIKCKYEHTNWLKFFMVALLPLSFFYVIVVIFKMNFVSGEFGGSVFALQILMAPIQLRDVDMWFHSTTALKGAIKMVKISYSIFGVVNLDFVCDIYSLFCISPNFTILHVLSLDYIVALYPYFLMVLTYVLIKLYDRPCVFLVWAWKPFKWFFQKYYKKLNVRTSLVEVFATFISLSSVKIIAVSTTLLTWTRVHDEFGRLLEDRYFYYNSSIEYFGSEHVPFGILAILMLFIFVFIPFILLLVYPCGCFQRILNSLNWNCEFLRVFMDAFQGTYKTHPRDMRYFSAYYFFLRLILLFITGYEVSIFTLPLTLVVLLLSIMVLIVFQPHNKDVNNRIDTLSMIMMILFFAIRYMFISTFLLDPYKNNVSNKMAFTCGSIIILYFIMLFSWTIFGYQIKHLQNRLCRAKSQISEEQATYDSIETFDRDHINLVSNRCNKMCPQPKK